ncbi:MAG: hypothetical protein RSF79_29690, partial [Janthinobacterium sp.]
LFSFGRTCKQISNKSPHSGVCCRVRTRGSANRRLVNIYDFIEQFNAAIARMQSSGEIRRIVDQALLP